MRHFLLTEGLLAIILLRGVRILNEIQISMYCDICNEFTLSINYLY
jgi:hypothetical protein